MSTKAGQLQADQAEIRQQDLLDLMILAGDCALKSMDSRTSATVVGARMTAARFGRFLLGAAYIVLIASLLPACAQLKSGRTVPGNTVWKSNYKKGGPGWGPVMTVDRKDSVYVAGAEPESSRSRFVTIKYNSVGAQEWVKTYTGAERGQKLIKAIALDGRGNIYITGRSSKVYTIIKYDADGNEKWVRRPVSRRALHDLTYIASVLGPEDDVYITCGGGDIFKYGPEGSRRWARRQEFLPQSIGVDDAGNVYVSGAFNGNNGNLTAKYDKDGNEKWVRRIPRDGGSYYAMAVAERGDVYVSGEDGGIVKYDTEGNLQWQNKEARLIGLDRSGNLYMAASDGMAKYSPSGRKAWSIRLDLSLGGLVVGAKGDVYVTGSTDLDIQADDHSPYKQTTAKYDSSGHRIWIRHFTEEWPDQPDRKLPATSGSAIALGHSGNVVVSGYSEDFGLRSGGYTTISYVR